MDIPGAYPTEGASVTAKPQEEHGAMRGHQTTDSGVGLEEQSRVSAPATKNESSGSRRISEAFGGGTYARDDQPRKHSIKPVVTQESAPYWGNLPHTTEGGIRNAVVGHGSPADDHDNHHGLPDKTSTDEYTSPDATVTGITSTFPRGGVHNGMTEREEYKQHPGTNTTNMDNMDNAHSSNAAVIAPGASTMKSSDHPIQASTIGSREAKSSSTEPAQKSSHAAEGAAACAAVGAGFASVELTRKEKGTAASNPATAADTNDFQNTIIPDAKYRSIEEATPGTFAADVKEEEIKKQAKEDAKHHENKGSSGGILGVFHRRSDEKDKSSDTHGHNDKAASNKGKEPVQNTLVHDAKYRSVEGAAAGTFAAAVAEEERKKQTKEDAKHDEKKGRRSSLLGVFQRHSDDKGNSSDVHDHNNEAISKESKAKEPVQNTLVHDAQYRSIEGAAPGTFAADVEEAERQKQAKEDAAHHENKGRRGSLLGVFQRRSGDKDRSSDAYDHNNQATAKQATTHDGVHSAVVADPALHRSSAVGAGTDEQFASQDEDVKRISPLKQMTQPMAAPAPIVSLGKSHSTANKDIHKESDISASQEAGQERISPLKQMTQTMAAPAPIVGLGKSTSTQANDARHPQETEKLAENTSYQRETMPVAAVHKETYASEPVAETSQKPRRKSSSTKPEAESPSHEKKERRGSILGIFHRSKDEKDSDKVSSKKSEEESRAAQADKDKSKHKAEMTAAGLGAGAATAAAVAHHKKEKDQNDKGKDYESTDYAKDSSSLGRSTTNNTNASAVDEPPSPSSGRAAMWSGIGAIGGTAARGQAAGSTTHERRVSNTAMPTDTTDSGPYRVLDSGTTSGIKTESDMPRSTHPAQETTAPRERETSHMAPAAAVAGGAGVATAAALSAKNKETKPEGSATSEQLRTSKYEDMDTDFSESAYTTSSKPATTEAAAGSSAIRSAAGGDVSVSDSTPRKNETGPYNVLDSGTPSGIRI